MIKQGHACTHTYSTSQKRKRKKKDHNYSSDLVLDVVMYDTSYLCVCEDTFLLHKIEYYNIL